MRHIGHRDDGWDEMCVNGGSGNSGNSGELHDLSQQQRTGTGTYKVKVKVLTKDDRLKIGMTAKLSIIVKEVDNVMTVPYDAVVDKGDGEYVVYAIDEATVRKIEQRKEAG